MRKITQTVRFKLMAALGLCTLLIVIMGVFSAYSIERLDSMVRDEYETALKPTRELGSVRADEIELRLQLRRLQIFQDPVQQATAVSTINRAITRVKRNWSDYYPSQVSSGEERLVADSINEKLGVVHNRVFDAVHMFESGNPSGAVAIIDDQAKLSDSLLKDIDTDIEINDRQAKDFTNSSAQAANETLIVAIILALVGVVLSIAASVYLTRAILQPLKNAVGIANTIAEGQLGRPVNSNENGEFGELLQSLRRMDEQLVAAVSQIQSSSEAVSTAAKEIASGNMDLAARTEEQAASLQQTASSMTELTETVQQTAANASTANNLAKGASDLASGGEQSVKKMVNTIDLIAASSSRISEITTVIEGIAFQTNILALNAAVEAARAGTHGQGFAVVAAEVRNLAQRSSVAAKEIKQLIVESNSVSGEGTKQAKNVSDSIVEIRNAIQNVSQIVSEIAAASNEQSRGIEQVDLAVTQMDVVTQQNAALVEEASAAAQSLNEQAELLVRAASAFRLDVAYR